MDDEIVRMNDDEIVEFAKKVVEVNIDSSKVNNMIKAGFKLSSLDGSYNHYEECADEESKVPVMNLDKIKLTGEIRDKVNYEFQKLTPEVEKSLAAPCHMTQDDVCVDKASTEEILDKWHDIEQREKKIQRQEKLVKDFNDLCRSFTVDVDVAPEKVETFMKSMKEQMNKKAVPLPPMTKLLVFYVNVGQLSPDASDKFVERLKEKYSVIKSRLPKHVEMIYIPTRERTTGLEILDLT